MSGIVDGASASRRAAVQPGSGASRHCLLAIVGPTATGKTALAIQVAGRLGGEIISADSRQAYRGLEIGTAAPSQEERRRVRHHGIGFLPPEERYSAGAFARRARGWIEQIEARGHVSIVCGGTGFFLRALLEPMFREPPLDPDRRRGLATWLAGRTREELEAWVRRLDRRTWERRRPLDRQRAMRALELVLLTGRPLGWWQERRLPAVPPPRARSFVLELDPEEHRRRIRERARRLLDAGWVEEVQELLHAGCTSATPAMSSVGYRTVAALARGELSREEALEAIVRDTWRYARRQRTWFRHQLPSDAVALDAGRPVEDLTERVTREWRRWLEGGEGR